VLNACARAKKSVEHMEVNMIDGIEYKMDWTFADKANRGPSK